MSSPLVSVIIPVYNQAEFLAEALESVLQQTYQSFEIIIVNDASPDDTDNVVKQFSDPRIKYIVHETNQKLPTTRNTGMHASQGELLFFLDADDMYHPEKLHAHVSFMEDHPDVGVSYSARFELNHSARTIRELWRPPTYASLVDLMLGFPFAPSDTVVRRDWAFKVGLFDPAMKTAEDTDFPCRLALAGCKFAGIDRALTYHRYHSGRRRADVPGRMNDVRRALDAVLADPRCPPDVQAVGSMSLKHHLMAHISRALNQDETEFARDCIRELVEIDPSVIEGEPCEFVEFLLFQNLIDETIDHEPLFEKILKQLPDELSSLYLNLNWMVGRGYLWKGIRAIMWGREEDGRTYLDRAIDLNAHMDKAMMQRATYHLMNFENEFGVDAVMKVVSNLSSHVNRLTKSGRSDLEGSYLINRAFEFYRLGEYKKVPWMVITAVTNDPMYLINRGVWSIFIRSMMRAVL